MRGSVAAIHLSTDISVCTCMYPCNCALHALLFCVCLSVKTCNDFNRCAVLCSIQVVRKMRKHFCPGQCLTLTVLETAVSKAFVELSLIGTDVSVYTVKSFVLVYEIGLHPQAHWRRLDVCLKLEVLVLGVLSSKLSVKAFTFNFQGGN